MDFCYYTPFVNIQTQNLIYIQRQSLDRCSVVGWTEKWEEVLPLLVVETRKLAVVCSVHWLLLKPVNSIYILD